MEEWHKKQWEAGCIGDINGGGNAQDPSYMPTNGPSGEGDAWISSSNYSAPMGNYHPTKKKTLNKPKLISWQEWLNLQQKDGKNE